MPRLRIPAILAATLVLAIAPIVSAATLRGLLPSTARVLGYSTTDLAVGYMHWIMDDPVQAVDCAQSDLDPRIWYLPEVTSEGGVPNVECSVPTGSFLVIVPGFWECSSLEDEPFHGTTEAELIDCVNAGFAYIETASITIDGRTSSDLDRYVLRTPVMDLPAGNIFSDDPGISMTKGFFAVVGPLTPGVHHARVDALYPEFGFEGLTDYTISVR
jgi:hypothetical protein